MKNTHLLMLFSKGQYFFFLMLPVHVCALHLFSTLGSFVVNKALEREEKERKRKTERKKRLQQGGQLCLKHCIVNISETQEQMLTESNVFTWDFSQEKILL